MKSRLLQIHIFNKKRNSALIYNTSTLFPPDESGLFF